MRARICGSRASRATKVRYRVRATAEKERNIARFVGCMGDVARECAMQALLDADPILLSAGGSAYFDMVTALPRSLAGRATQIVIRSGCYLTHDSDSYAQAAQRMRERMPALAALGEGLRDALEVWAYVQSRPERGLAILTMGKRDVSHDLHLPFARMRLPARVATRGRGRSRTAARSRRSTTSTRTCRSRRRRTSRSAT